MAPASTYRLQLHAGFTFADAATLVPYLHALGITDLYSSPVFAARAGSTHGYDVTDPTRLSPALGGEEGFAALSAALQQHDMGLLMDIVPNHMAASPENLWWLSVLENGPSSEYAAYFDILWHQSATGAPMENKVLLPILGGHYGSVLEKQELRVALDEDGFYLTYWETRLPLDPKTYRIVLEQRYGQLRDLLGTNLPAFREYEAVMEAIEQLPDRMTTEPQAIERRRRETGRLKQEIWRLYSHVPEIRQFIDDNLALVNGHADYPESFDLLDRLLSEQAYRLAYWRVASQEINYRRFFDVADLVSMRIEDEEVFTARHAPLDDLVASGQLTGLRIDHIDGLHDPEDYLRQLQAFLAPARVYPGVEPEPFYIVVEKILAEGEDLRESWPAAGTTGYDFLNLVNGLFIDTRSLDRLDALYRRISGIQESFEQIAYAQKRKVMAELFSGDVRALVVRLDRLSLFDRHGRDLTQRELGQALTEVAARFTVYRTYVRTFEVDDLDRQHVERAIEAAMDARPELTRAFRFLRRVLLLEFPTLLPEEERQEWLALVMRWQQFSGPIMAKGHEDTALYIYNRLVSVNDVGGEPGRVGVSPADFHATSQKRATRWPKTLNATSTHDTKRSEDVRARINVLSELPEAWEERVGIWQQINQPHRRSLGGQPVPDGNVEYLIYQTLVGAWPLDDAEVPAFTERLKQYLMKANREAKIHTSWINTNEDYEAGIAMFVDALLSPYNDAFLSDFTRFQREVSWYGALNSLSQTLLKMTAPGVPDIYQGTELWDFSLVDPDNRRPVDFAMRRRMLAELTDRNEQPATLLERWQDGCIKLHLLQRTLHFRRSHRELVLKGDYLPLQVRGARDEHVIAFARRYGDAWALVIAPRLLARLSRTAGFATSEAPVGERAWLDTAVALPPDAPDAWRNILDDTAARGNDLRLSAVLARLPYALLVSVTS
jgi:(1->4)-alpha-D-glucan 1-alpha-D-glucosylmutase